MKTCHVGVVLAAQRSGFVYQARLQLYLLTFSPFDAQVFVNTQEQRDFLLGEHLFQICAHGELAVDKYERLAGQDGQIESILGVGHQVTFGAQGGHHLGLKFCRKGFFLNGQPRALAVSRQRNRPR